MALMDDDQILTGLVRIIGMIQDGHNHVDITRGTDRDENYPLRLAWYPNGIFVERAAPDAVDLVGGRLVSIDDQPVDSVIERVLPLIPHDPDNPGFALTRLSEYATEAHLLHGLGITRSASQAHFVVEKNGKRESRSLHPGIFSRRSFYHSPPADWPDARQPDTPPPLWRVHRDSTFWMKYLPEQRTLYVQINGIADDPQETLADFSRRMSDTAGSTNPRRLILDLRWNDGGNNYLLRPLIVSLIRLPEIDRRGHLFVLIGPRTFSAAQNLVNRLQNFTEAIFVGSPTGENVNFYGDTKRFVLPNSMITVALANLWWQDMDPRDKRKATYPEVAVEETFDDYVHGRDPALEYILRHDEILTIEESILRGLKEGGYHGARGACAAFVADPVHKYVEAPMLEGRINNLGYALIGRNESENAIAVLKLNTELFPSSFNTWDSLGEAYADAGRKEEAIAAYKESLRLNPTSRTGLEALSRLQK